MLTEQTLFSIILPPTVSMAGLTSMPAMPWHGPTLVQRGALAARIFICPIAIAYSYGTDNKIGFRLSVCLCVITLTVAFLCRFSSNLT